MAGPEKCYAAPGSEVCCNRMDDCVFKPAAIRLEEADCRHCAKDRPDCHADFHKRVAEAKPGTITEIPECVARMSPEDRREFMNGVCAPPRLRSEDPRQPGPATTSFTWSECGITFTADDRNDRDDANPKDIAGRAKPQLHLIPSPALIEVAKVMGNGAFKYGPYNWRHKKICHTAYIAAAERHTRSHLDGELMDPDAARSHPEKGVPPNHSVYHLAAAAAGLLILLDAILTDNAIDDRPPAGVAGQLINPPKEAP